VDFNLDKQQRMIDNSYHSTWRPSISCHCHAIDMICDRFVIDLSLICELASALKSLRNRFYITFQSLCNCSAIDLQSVYNLLRSQYDRLGFFFNRHVIAIKSLSIRSIIAFITLQSLCHRFAIALQSIAIALESFSNRYAIAIQSLSN
jgi:hypothetical protein